MYSFYLQGRDGKKNILKYNAEKHALFQGGEILMPPSKPIQYAPRPKAEDKVLRISLGKRCNFKCEYCMQHMAGGENSTEDAPDIFALDKSVRALRPLMEKERFGVVQFWGGEPLLYFETIRYLHEKLSAISPDTDFALCTNGSLLHGKKLQWLLDKNIKVTLSWDGEGQILRGGDPLKSERTRRGIKTLFEKNQCTLSPVITRASGHLADIAARAKEILDVDTIPIADAPILVVHDAVSEKAALPLDKLQPYATRMFKWLLAGGTGQCGTAGFRALSFLRRMNTSPLHIGETACFVGRDNTLTVDLRGNILTCQNFEASSTGENGESFCLGSLYSSAPTARPDLRTLEDRQENRCKACEVRMICKGGCPYWQKAYVDYNCKAAKAQAMPILGMAMYMLTGDVLTEVSRA